MKIETHRKKILQWLASINYIMQQVYQGNWKHYAADGELVYSDIYSAAIALCMSYATACKNNRTEMTFMLKYSPLYTNAGSDVLTDAVVEDVVLCAWFTRVVLHTTAQIVLMVLYIFGDVHTISELCSLTQLSTKTVEHVVVTLLNKGFIKKVSRGSYFLVGDSKVIYYCRKLLNSSNTVELLCSCILVNVKTGGFKQIPNVVIDDTGKVTLSSTHPHFYPWVATPARQKIFCKDSIPPTQEKIFSTPNKKGPSNAMVTKPVSTQSLEIWGPIEYDIPLFLMNVCGAPDHISQGFETVKICCPDTLHNDSNPSCTVFAAGNAYCHSCHRKFRDIREVASCFVDLAFYADDWIGTEEAITDVLAPYLLNGGKLDPNTVTYQHITQRHGQGILQYELDAMRERYAGVFKNGTSHYGKNWQDLSAYSQAQYELFCAGYSIATMEDWHVYTFDLDPWFKIRVPLVTSGVVVGEQAISTQTDRGRGAGKYYTSPGLEKQKHVYGPLDLGDSACMVVEGLKDCWRVYQRGFKNVCTTLGSSMSDEQADYLAKHFTTVFLAYDNDRAGREGYREAYNKLVARFVKVQQVVYAAKDPDLCPIGEWRSAVIKACSNAGYFTPSEVWDYGVHGS